MYLLQFLDLPNTKQIFTTNNFVLYNIIFGFGFFLMDKAYGTGPDPVSFTHH